MGATRDIALTNLPLRGLSINPDADNETTITVVPSDSGVMFINKESSGCAYTLPAVADGAGKWFWFYGAVAAALAVTATTAIVVGADSLTGTTLTSNSTIGDCLFVVGDGTNWYGFMVTAAWT